MRNTAKTMDAHDWALLISLSVLWGGAFFFAGVALKQLPPLTVVLVRVSLAAVMLLPVFWYFWHRLPKTTTEWAPFLGMGLLNNVLPFGFLFAGQTQITVGLASIVNAMTPLFTVLVMAAFHEERITSNRVIGVTLGLVGVAILRGLEEPLHGAQTLGIVLCMAGALSYGFAALWGRRKLADVPPLRSATCQLICSTVIMLPIVLLVDQPWTLPALNLATIWSLIALALLGTALAYLVFFKILVRAGASNVMLVTLLIPVTAILLGNLFLDEPVTTQQLAGALIIGAGLLFIDGRLVERFRQQPSVE